MTPRDPRSLYYNVHRWYMPGNGTYSRPDPFGIVSQAAFSPSSGQDPSRQLYGHAAMNPVIRFDPLGLKSRVCCRKIPVVGVFGFRHCYIETQTDTGRATCGLFGGPGSGEPPGTGRIYPNAGFDTGGDCGDWSDDDDCETDQCVVQTAQGYNNPSQYDFNSGPNSNTFAGTIARQCKLDVPLPVGWRTPGWNAPPRTAQEGSGRQAPEARGGPMQGAVSLTLSAAGFALLTIVSCAGGPVTWPRWARELDSKLECGMTLDEAQRLSSRQLQTLEAGAHPWLGRHYVRKGSTDFWLRFNDDNRLEWVTLSEMDGWRVMATRQSPRRNLCTGELTYQIRLDWTVQLEDARVYLDGEAVEPEGGKITVSSGEHEVRIEKLGYEPIVRHLDLGPADRGDQSLDLRSVNLHRAVAQGRGID